MLNAYISAIDSENEKAVFMKLYMQYKNQMYNCAYRILEDNYLAEDAVHNAFVSLSKCLGRINGMNDNEKRCYLLIVVRNASYLIFKEREKFPNRESSGESVISDENLQANIEANEAAEKIFKMIKSLDKPYSDVLVLKLFYDMSDSEMAKSMGISIENVRVRYFRGKAKLKRLMEKEGICND